MRLALALLLLLAAALLPVASREASAETRLVAQSVVNEFPRRLVFKLTAESDADITDVTLRYTLSSTGIASFSKPVSFRAGKSVAVEVLIDVNSSSNYIPVGNDFTYFWEITTAEGRTETPPERWFYLPPNREWKSVANDFMVVYYHGERANVAQSYLDAGAQTYQDIGRKLLNVDLKQLPIRVILFAVESELEPARPGSGARFDAAVTTCGTKVTSDIVFVIPQSCGTGDRTDTLRHEFGHILNEAAGDGPQAKLPSWLDEGTAVMAQTEPGQNFVGPFQTGVRVDRLIPFSQMGTTASDARQVGLFYGQAYFMAKHLLDKYGQPKFAELFATIKGGTRFDEALRKVYGFDLAGFERDFRAAHKLGQVATPTPGATQRPSGSPTATSTRAGTLVEPADDDGGGVNLVVLGIVALAVVFGLVAVMLYLFATMQARKRSSAPAPGPPFRPPDDEWTRRDQ